MSENISLYIYDTNFNLVDVVDEWISLIWKSVFNGDVGGFDLQIPATSSNIDIFKLDYFVERSDKYSWKPTAKVSGGKSMMQCRDLMVIEAIEIRGGSDEGMTLTIGGVHITSLLKRRVNLDSFATFANEFNGFWGKLSQCLIFDDVPPSASLQVDHRRGMPVQKLLSYNENGGGIYDAEHLGFLNTYSAQATAADVVPARLTSGFPVSGKAIMYQDDTIGTDIYITPDYHSELTGRIIETTDNQYLLAVNVSALYSDRVTTATFYRLAKKPPRPAYPITKINYSFSSLILVHPYNVPTRAFEYNFVMYTDNPPIILTDNDVGAAFIIGLATGATEIGIITSADAISSTRGIISGKMLRILLGAEQRTLYQAQKTFEHDNWFDILTSICQSNDTGLSLYYDDAATDKFKFAIYDGEVRNVFFSVDNNNLVSFRSSTSQEEYANIEYIVGTYPANPADQDIKEIDLTTYTPASVAEDILRREVYTESDIDYRDESTDVIIGIDTFRDMLISAAAADLDQNHKKKNDFDCEIVANSSLYLFNEDYFIGDIIKIQPPVGNIMTARITETTESWDNEGYKVQLRLRYISEEDSLQLLAAESGDLITDEDNNNIEIEGA